MCRRAPWSNWPWYYTDGDTGTGDPSTVTGSGPNAQSVTTKKVGTKPRITYSTCVWACCEYAGGGGCPVGAPPLGVMYHLALSQMRVVLSTVLGEMRIGLAQRGPSFPVFRGTTLAPLGGTRVILA